VYVGVFCFEKQRGKEGDRVGIVVLLGSAKTVDWENFADGHFKNPGGHQHIPSATDILKRLPIRVLTTHDVA
jgi:hypothetical protein